MSEQVVWSDVDATARVFPVRCTSCTTVREVRTQAEQAGSYTANGDGTFTDLLGECADCIGDLERHQVYDLGTLVYGYLPRRSIQLLIDRHLIVVCDDCTEQWEAIVDAPDKPILEYHFLGDHAWPDVIQMIAAIEPDLHVELSDDL